MDNFLKNLDLILDSKDENISLFANMSAYISEQMENLNWVGFYLVKNNNLYLGPFQGRVACTNIKYGCGVCGTCLKLKKTINVANVHDFVGHIACDCRSNSELVIPVFSKDNVVAILDIDSPILNRFTLQEQNILEQAVKILESKLKMI